MRITDPELIHVSGLVPLWVKTLGPVLIILTLTVYAYHQLKLSQMCCKANPRSLCKAKQARDLDKGTEVSPTHLWTCWCWAYQLSHPPPKNSVSPSSPNHCTSLLGQHSFTTLPTRWCGAWIQPLRANAHPCTGTACSKGGTNVLYETFAFSWVVLLAHLFLQIVPLIIP